MQQIRTLCMRSFIGLVLGFASLNIAQAQTLHETVKLLASDAESDDFLGRSVAIDGGTAVIGAPGDDDQGDGAGAVYIFVRSGGAWVQQQKLTASDGESGDGFGSAMALYENTLIIGAPYANDMGEDSGSAYVFRRDARGIWSLQQKLTSSDAEAWDEFGISVAVEGDVLVIGAFGDDAYAGSAYVFNYQGTTWSEQQKLVAGSRESLEFYGVSVAIDENFVAVGAYLDYYLNGLAGSVYVYGFDGDIWTEQQRLTPSNGWYDDLFGSAIDLDAGNLVVGAPYDNASAECTGAAYLFTRYEQVWSQQQKLVASDCNYGDEFGNAVAVDGDRIAIGNTADDDAGEDSGSAYLFIKSNGIWQEQMKLLASDGLTDDRLGVSVAVSDSTVLVGAPGFDSSQSGNIGAAYLFDAECGGDFCIRDASWSYKNRDTGWGFLDITGFSPYTNERITIINGVTGEQVFRIRSKPDGTFMTTARRGMFDDSVPCSVQAVVDADASNVRVVSNAPEDCIGQLSVD